MTKHLNLDLDRLHRSMLALCARVEEMIDKASQALREGKLSLVGEVIDADVVVDQIEVQIEDECLKILALHQPVAIDLRRIATVLKVNNDLERIADLACSIAQRAEGMHTSGKFTAPPKLEVMVEMSTQMVRSALDAFVNLDVDAARTVLASDDKIDELNVEIINEIQDIMRREPEKVPQALHCFSASRHIERIADHATNIAEDVVYLVEGEIVRHGRWVTPV